MLKKDAIQLLGKGSSKLTAERLDLTREAFWKWPDVLNTAMSDRVRGAAIRHHIGIPTNLRDDQQVVDKTPEQA